MRARFLVERRFLLLPVHNLDVGPGLSGGFGLYARVDLSDSEGVRAGTGHAAVRLEGLVVE